jgi:hypothetical protein
VAGGSRTPGAALTAAATEPCAAATPNITRLELPAGATGFLASSAAASLPVTVELAWRAQVSSPRTARPDPAPPLIAPAARIAAIVRARLGFVHTLEVARLGYFSFGSTAPPPFQA